MEKFIFYRNTKDRCDFEQEEEAMEKMNDDKEVITYDEFVKDVEGFEEIATTLGYDDDDDLPVKDDWHVGFYESEYGGLPCRMFEHSECDFIFLRPKDALMLAQAFNANMTPLEWKRHTQFGSGGLDPSADKFADDVGDSHG